MTTLLLPHYVVFPSPILPSTGLKLTHRPTHTYSFFALHTIIHPRAVTEFAYRYSSSSRAHIFLSFKLETLDRASEVADLLAAMERQEMKGYDISDDEMAKTHARYMIGGTSDVGDERLFRFGEFLLSLLPCRFFFVWLPVFPCVVFLSLGRPAIGTWDFVRTRAGGWRSRLFIPHLLVARLPFTPRLHTRTRPCTCMFLFHISFLSKSNRNGQCSAELPLRSFSPDILARDAGWLAYPALPCLASTLLVFGLVAPRLRCDRLCSGWGRNRLHSLYDIQPAVPALGYGARYKHERHISR